MVATFDLFIVGELIVELLDDAEVDRNALPTASLEGEKRSGTLGLGSCQSVRCFRQ
jgi:hypothetical protein